MTRRATFEHAIDTAIGMGRLGRSGRKAAGPRLVYADWLDEQNTEADARLAAAQRWLAGRLLFAWSYPSGYGWRRGGPYLHSLPAAVFKRLRGGRRVGKGTPMEVAVYKTRRAAESALATALRRAGVTV